MAGQLHDKNEGMSDEYNKDNDVKDGLHCDPCKDDGIQVKATCFCINCNDYLCTECHHAHKRSKLSRNHVLTNKDSIPKSKLEKEKKSEQCQEHRNEPIQWYCMTHNTCLCNTCKRVYHRNCTYIKPLADVSQNFLSSEELEKVKGRLMHLLKAFDQKLLRIKDNTELVKSCYATAIEEVLRSFAKIKDEDLERMKSLEVTCDTTILTISSVLNEIETLQQSDEEDRTFVATRKAESQLQAYCELLASVDIDNRITNYRYICEPKSTRDGVIGKVFSWKDGHALKIDDFSVKTSTDKRRNDITGMDILSDNRFVIADRNNDKIKLIDMTRKTVISELKLDWKPWDLTRIDDNTIAITTYDKTRILLVSLSDRLTVQNTIFKGEFKYCQGIVYSNSSLIVSYYGPNKLQIMNLNGTVKHVIEDRGKYGNIYHLAQNPDTNILYFSDYSRNTVSSMTLDGQVLSSFTHEHMVYPRGITVGRDGRIFVCSYHTHRIFEVSSDLSEGQVILDSKDGISYPLSIHYDGYKIYVGSYNNKSIQVFMP